MQVSVCEILLRRVLKMSKQLFDEFDEMAGVELYDYIRVDSSLLVLLKLMKTYNLSFEDVGAKLLGVLE